MGTYNQALNDNIDNLKVNETEKKSNEKIANIEENYLERHRRYDTTNFVDLTAYTEEYFEFPEDGVIQLYHGANAGSYYCYFNLENLTHNWSKQGYFALTETLQVYKGQKIKVTAKSGTFSLRYYKYTDE